MAARTRYPDEIARIVYERALNETQADIARDLGIPRGSMTKLRERGRVLHENETRATAPEPAERTPLAANDPMKRALDSLPDNPTAAQVSAAIRENPGALGEPITDRPPPPAAHEVTSPVIRLGTPITDEPPPPVQTDGPPPTSPEEDARILVRDADVKPVVDDSERAIQEILELLPAIREVPEQLAIFQESAGAIIGRIQNLEKELANLKSQAMLDIAKAIVAAVSAENNA